MAQGVRGVAIPWPCIQKEFSGAVQHPIAELPPDSAAGHSCWCCGLGDSRVARPQNDNGPTMLLSAMVTGSGRTTARGQSGDAVAW